MNNFQIIGMILFALGILMTVFHRPIGIGFCRLGKRVWSKTDLPIAEDAVKSGAYDEAKVPRIMLFLGIINVIDGVVLWFLPRLIQ